MTKNTQNSERYLLKSSIYGLAVGDALGVPWEASKEIHSNVQA